jgi:DNA-binding transcriptional ArsR family regulator
MRCMDEALAAIAEPRRREILHLVRDQELAAGHIASHFSISRPAISQHLRVLKDAGLVSERREGTHRYYRLRHEGLTGITRYLETLWDERLSRLQAEAERQERELRRAEEEQGR